MSKKKRFIHPRKQPYIFDEYPYSSDAYVDKLHDIIMGSKLKERGYEMEDILGCDKEREPSCNLEHE